MSTTVYNTKQKKYIEKILLENKDAQLTCEQIVDLLKSNGTPVGKATVYRFIENLTVRGEVRKSLSVDGKSSAYQYIDKSMNCDGHLHLKCTSCGKLIHLGCEFMHSVDKHVREHHSFKIDNSKTVILGLCESCCAE